MLRSRGWGSVLSGWLGLGLVSLALGGALNGCADPEGELQAFGERCRGQIDRGDLAGGTTCDPVSKSLACENSCEDVAPEAIDGLYYFVLSASIGVYSPFVFLTEVTTSVADEGGLNMTWKMQPLAAADRKTPVGEAFTIGPLQVKNGSISYFLEQLAIPNGEANPLTGNPIKAADIDILSCPSGEAGSPGGLCEVADFYCGSLPKGSVTDPTRLDIGGSTWTMERINSVEEHTEPPYVNCKKDQADPLK